ncbi:serine hydrolase [Moritella sp. F3]|uniref:serine hydrolase domain-containing protein n=1 Tax=Moritella sp. F3 TaxID=2718882 RepID=UPI0018E1BD5B|nr:serine hydrolase domain-containing protein [Moritella sp. F3]GIC78841.1 EstA family serine hydrolase [Moritella sp. F1]GIC81924.1 EstA family serine hydrolase [Moritella sp. F3]
MIIDFGLKNLVRANRYLRFGNTIHLPESLATVTTINRDEEVEPLSVGMTRDGVDAIWQSVEEIYKTATHPAISLCFRRQGKIILSRSIGYANGHKPNEKADIDARLMQPETPICYFSGSKAVTAFLIHLLNEDKLINLHDTVSTHLPEFGQHGKQGITIHQVLSHRSGMSTMPSSLGINALADNDEIWQQLCAKQLPTTEVGKLAYHAVSGGYILERIIKQASGMSIQKFLDLRVRKPMQMKYFCYGLDDTEACALADNYATGIKAMYPISYFIKRVLGGSFEHVAEVSNTAIFQQAVIPSANLMGTAEEMGRFYQMLLNDGVWEGKQICQPVTVQGLTQETGTLEFDRTLMAPMRYSAGMMLGASPVGLWGINSAQAFGHIGLINKLLWADPERDITVSLVNTGLPFVANHVPSLINFMANINKHCSR